MAWSVRQVRDISVGNVVVGSVWAWAACVLLMLSALFFTIAFGTMGWGYASFAVSGFRHQEVWGLWTVCSKNPDTNEQNCAPTAKSGLGWYAAAQGLSCTALLLSYATLAVSISYLVWHRFHRDQRVSAVLCGLCVLTGVMLLTAATTFGAGWSNYILSNLPEAHYLFKLSYSFALAIVASIFTLVSAGLLLWELMTSRNMIPA